MIRFVSVCAVLVAMLFIQQLECVAQFTTVITIPENDPDIGDFGSIGSDTQLNLNTGGSIGSNFTAGSADGSSLNIEVNVLGGTIATDFNAYSGSTVNMFDGTINGTFTGSGSSINIFGGYVEVLRSFGTAVASISGGVVERFDLHGDTVNYSGGTIGDGFRIFDEGHIYGDNFRLDGIPIAGLNAIGDIVTFSDLQENSVFSGTLADGTPFALVNFYNDIERDYLFSVQIHVASLPATGPGLIELTGASGLLGVRQGQTLQVAEGGIIGDNFNAGWGSTVEVSGGQIGRNFEATGAQVTISSGNVGDDFDAFPSSIINVSGGQVGNYFDAHKGSEVNLSGGSIGEQFDAFPDSIVNISGGAMGDRFRAFEASVVNISGGSVGEDFLALDGSVVNMSGGSFGFNPGFIDGSKLNLFGTQFALDGVDLTSGLTPGVPFAVNDRDVSLTGVLADGTPFEFFLEDTVFRPIFQEGLFQGALTVTIIPEPSTLALAMLGLSGICYQGRKRKRKPGEV